MNPTLTVANYLKENSVPLANQIVDDIIEQFCNEVPEEEVNQAKLMYVEFLRFLGESIQCTKNSVPDELVIWSKNNGERTASNNQRISDILIRYPDTRIIFTDYLMDIALKHGLKTEDVVVIIKRVNQLLDISINETVFAFERRTNEIIQNARKEIIELSIPIVPIQSGIAVLPLIGNIDIERTEHLLNKVVPKLPSLNVSSLIIDFSGIVMIDIEVAGHIFTIHDVLRLLGVHVVITGIRPELASRVVSEGINFSSIKMFANVKQAIDNMN